MKTTEEKLRQIHKGCDEIVDRFGPYLNSYDQGRYDLAKEILNLIEEQ